MCACLNQVFSLSLFSGVSAVCCLGSTSQIENDSLHLSLANFVSKYSYNLLDAVLFALSFASFSGSLSYPRFVRLAINNIKLLPRPHHNSSRYSMDVSLFFSCYLSLFHSSLSHLRQFVRLHFLSLSFQFKYKHTLLRTITPFRSIGAHLHFQLICFG